MDFALPAIVFLEIEFLLYWYPFSPTLLNLDSKYQLCYSNPDKL